MKSKQGCNRYRKETRTLKTGQSSREAGEITASSYKSTSLSTGEGRTERGVWAGNMV